MSLTHASVSFHRTLRAWRIIQNFAGSKSELFGIMSTIPNLLKKLPKLADLSLNTVVKIELNDSPNPTIETIQKIAKALDVSVDDLLKK